MSGLRIGLILEQALAPVPGGTGRYSVELAGALARTAPDGASVAGWTAWHRNRSPAAIRGVRGPRPLPLPRRPLTLAWERHTGPAPWGADVLHAPTLLAPPRRRTPMVVTIHDAVPWTHPDTLTPRGVGWHRRMAEYAVRHADRIVVPTHAVAEELRDVLPLDDRVRVIGHGVTTAVTGVVPEADRIASALQLPPEGYLLSLATLEPRKGLDVLIAALADPAAPDLPLLLVGRPGWGGIDPLAEAARRGLDPGRIRVLGGIDDTQLAVVLQRATALVMPSRSEGFGLPVVEAMAAGTAVVHSDAPALVETAAGAGFAVPRDRPAELAAALRAVAEDDAARADLVARGRQRVAGCTWDAVAETTWNLYTALL